MKIKSCTWVLLLSVIALTGCISREQADARLARGCAAGAEIFLPEGNKIVEIKDSVFRDDPSFGNGYREVRLFVSEGDDWYASDKEYKCIFIENMGPFGSSHTATIYQLKVNGQTFGQEGSKIIGSFDDHLKLTETVEQGMNN